MTLLNEVGMGMQDIDRIILAGGFGSYVDLEKAMTIGLLPEVDPNKVIFVGNGSDVDRLFSMLRNARSSLYVQSAAATAYTIMPQTETGRPTNTE